MSVWVDEKHMFDPSVESGNDSDVPDIGAEDDEDDYYSGAELGNRTFVVPAMDTTVEATVTPLLAPTPPRPTVTHLLTPTPPRPTVMDVRADTSTYFVESRVTEVMRASSKTSPSHQEEERLKAMSPVPDRIVLGLDRESWDNGSPVNQFFVARSMSGTFSEMLSSPDATPVSPNGGSREFHASLRESLASSVCSESNLPEIEETVDSAAAAAAASRYRMLYRDWSQGSQGRLAIDKLIDSGSRRNSHANDYETSDWVLVDGDDLHLSDLATTETVLGSPRVRASSPVFLSEELADVKDKLHSVRWRLQLGWSKAGDALGITSDEDSNNSQRPKPRQDDYTLQLLQSPPAGQPASCDLYLF